MTSTTKNTGAGLGLGAIAGAAGTVAMDLLWYRRYRSDKAADDGGGDDSGTSGDVEGFAEWEFGVGTESFDDAGAPAKVGRKLAGFAGVELPDAQAATTDNVVHWATGISWGAVGGLLAATTSLPAVPAGVVAGVVAFGASYVALPALGVYQQIWEYDAATLWKDASAHLLFGAATGLALGALRAISRAASQ